MSSPKNPPKKNNVVSVVRSQDIKELNSERLKDHLYTGIFALQSTLWQQSQVESKRLESQSVYLDKLEENLFDNKVYGRLSDDQKIKLYSVMASQRNNTLKFLASLQGNITGAIAAIDHVKRQVDGKMQAPRSESGSTLDEVRVLIRDKIRQREETERLKDNGSSEEKIG